MDENQIESQQNEQLFDDCRQLRELIATAKRCKPNDRSETDRHFAIWITDLEKAYAFYKTYLYINE